MMMDGQEPAVCLHQAYIPYIQTGPDREREGEMGRGRTVVGISVGEMYYNCSG